MTAAGREQPVHLGLLGRDKEFSLIPIQCESLECWKVEKQGRISCILAWGPEPPALYQALRPMLINVVFFQRGWQSPLFSSK